MIYMNGGSNRNKADYKNKIAVIGCGPSGLIVMKELLHAGHDVICFEKQSRLGGIYNKISSSTRLTTSSLLTAFSEYSNNNENNPKFWNANEYIEYLYGFANAFQLESKIHFNTEVKTAQYNSTIQKWELDLEVTNTNTNIQYRIMVDCLAICSGMNSIPNIPQFEGQDNFRGIILHSNEYNKYDFINKRVLLIGGGETTADLSYEISKIASNVMITIRDTYGHIVPRIQTQNYVSDLNTNRCRYSNPYIWRHLIATITVLTQYILAVLFSDLKTQSIFKKIRELNRSQNTSAFSKFGCKSEGIVNAIVLHNAELYKRTIVKIYENTVTFNDGSTFDNCDVILLCTGYKPELPFFKKYHPELANVTNNPRSLFKQLLLTNRTDVAFFGLVRPAFGSIPPIVELQARLFALVINNRIQLPTNMEEIIRTDTMEWNRRFPNDAHRLKTLVDFQIYCDSLAEIIGCMPKLKQIFLINPYLFAKLFFGPFTMHQYRLFGPNSNVKRALTVYSKQPFGGIIESLITFTFLIISKLLYTCGVLQCKPNNF